MTREDYEREFRRLLVQMGINQNLSGYDYISFLCTEIITYSADLSDTSHRLTMSGLYKRAAHIYKKPLKNIKSGIRYAIRIVFSSGNTDLLEDIFGFSISAQSGVMTPKSFLYGLCNYMTGFSGQVK